LTENTESAAKKSPLLEKYKSRIKILSTHICYVKTLQLSLRKLQLLSPPHSRHWYLAPVIQISGKNTTDCLVTDYTWHLHPLKIKLEVHYFSQGGQLLRFDELIIVPSELHQKWFVRLKMHRIHSWSGLRLGLHWGILRCSPDFVI